MPDRAFFFFLNSLLLSLCLRHSTLLPFKPKRILDWLSANLLTVDATVQGFILIAAFGVALSVYRPIRERLTGWITTLKIPYRLTEILRSFTRLIIPVVALVFVFFGTKIAGSEAFAIKTGFCDAIIKLLSAWILIRLFVQFIENRFARNSFAMVIWAVAALSIFGVLEQTTRQP